MDRREAVQRIVVLLGGSVSAPTIAGLLAGCEAPSRSVPFEPRTLSREQLRRIETIAELIIPETDTPGASAARVHEFIDVMLTDFYTESERAQFLTELDRVDSTTRSLFGTDFAAVRADQRNEVLAALDAEAFPDESVDPEGARALEVRLSAGDPPFMRTMKELTVSGYYTSEIGQTVELRLPPFGPYQGDVPYERVGRSWA
jgi:gluconate 2-dehydrogenase gamma chain